MLSDHGWPYARVFLSFSSFKMEGLSPTKTKSFVSLFTETAIDPQQALISSSSHHGEPGLELLQNLVESLPEPFKFALIGNFSHDRPSVEKARHAFTKLNFKGSFSLAHFDPKHMLIRLHHEGDFNRIWMKELWFINASRCAYFAGHLIFGLTWNHRSYRYG